MSSPESRSPSPRPATSRFDAGSSHSVGWVPWRPEKVGSSAKWFWILLAGIVLIASGLRVVGMIDDFWLDEIWSWSFAMDKRSIVDIFTTIHHDNNHYLNTVWMHLLGNQPYLWLYRLHSFVAGLLSICGCGLLAGDIAFDCNESLRALPPAKFAGKKASVTPLIFIDSVDFARFCSLVAMLLLTTSYVPIVYSSEARGYSMAAVSGIYSTWLLRRIASDRSRRHLPQFGYAALSIVGILSHLSFVTVLLPHLIWGAYGFLRRRPLAWAICFVPVLAVIGGLWVIDLRYAVVGGAPTLSMLSVLLESLAMPMGAADNEVVVLVCATIIGLLLISGFVYLRRARFSDCLLFGLMFFLAPPLMIGMRSNGLLTTRHFIVVWICLFPLLGISVARLIAIPVGKFSLMPILLVFWLATNGWEFSQFAIHGRGHFDRTTRWLVAEIEKSRKSPGERQLIGTDHDFRNGMVLSFYLTRLSKDPGIDFRKQGQWPQSGVDWVIAHNVERGFQPQKEIRVESQVYDLVYAERFHAPIGWNWAIYHRHER